MIAGPFEITSALEPAGASYAAQEDVVLCISFKNMSDNQAQAPYLLDHLITYILKDIGHRTQKVVEYLPPKPPGVPRLRKFPTAPVDAHTTATYSLALQGDLGPLPAGNYSIQAKVDSPSATFTTEWLDFQIHPMQVAFPATSPFSEGDSHFFHLCWRDDGMKPPAVLHREMFIGGGSQLASRTIRIGQGDSASEPVASMAPAGRDPENFWVGWLARGKVSLSRVHGDNAVTYLIDLPGKANYKLVPALAYHEKPDGADPKLAGLLSGKDGRGYFLKGFLGAPPDRITWTEDFPIPAGELLAIRMVSVSPTFRCIFWTRFKEGKAHIESAYWHEEKGILAGPTLAKLSLAEAKFFQAFDAVTAGAQIKWSALFRVSGAKGEPADLQCWSHSLVGPEYRLGAGIPKATPYSAVAGPAMATLKLNPEGIPWILQRDIHGAWIQSPAWKDPIGVELPRGSRFESLYFKRGILPKVSYLDPEKGFESKAVMLPSEGNGTDEEVPPNR